METKQRKVVHSEGRQIIASVYRFLKREYEFTLTYKEPNSDISHLSNITQRTAEATGVSERTVQRILKEERDIPCTSSTCQLPMKKRRKRGKKVDTDELTSEDENDAEIKTEIEPEIEPEIKTEIEEEIKTEIKAEIKAEIKEDIKEEIKEENKEEIEVEIESSPEC